MPIISNVTISKNRKGRSSVLVDGVGMVGVIGVETIERRGGEESEVLIRVLGRLVQYRQDVSDEHRAFVGEQVV